MSKMKQNIMIAIPSLIVVGMLAGPSYFQYLNKYEEDSLCFVNQEYNHQYIIIDKSDNWGRPDIKRLRDFLVDKHASLPENDRMTIKVIHSTNSGVISEPLFDFCNPGNGEDANPLYQNPQRTKKRYLNSFDKPFKTLETVLTKSAYAAKTPLLNAITSSVNESPGKQVSITVVTDLMENSGQFNFYKTLPSVSEMIEVFPVSRNTASINIKYIERQIHSKRFRDATKKIWQDYFQHWNIRYSENQFMRVGSRP